MWPALISAGASLLGGLFGGGSKKQETVNRVDYARMVRDAEAAGFNPLTALRNGGAAGFSISTTPAAPLSARLADGVSAGVNNFLANFDPMADDKREAEFQLVQAQIRNLNASAAAMESQSFNVPGYGPDVIERRPSGMAGQLSRGTGQGPNGEVLPLYVDWFDPRTGGTVQLVNADAPDLDQMAVPPLAPLENTAGPVLNYPLPDIWSVSQDVWHEVKRGFPGVRDWWKSSANADYERHRAKYSHPSQ